MDKINGVVFSVFKEGNFGILKDYPITQEFILADEEKHEAYI